MTLLQTEGHNQSQFHDVFQLVPKQTLNIYFYGTPCLHIHHLLDRPGQVVLARLRSGHNRHRKLKFAPSPTCLCANRTVAISNSDSPEIIWALGGPEEDHQLHHCCWTGRVGEREEEEEVFL